MAPTPITPFSSSPFYSQPIPVSSDGGRVQDVPMSTPTGMVSGGGGSGMGTSLPRHGSFLGSSPLAGPSRWAGGDPSGVLSGLSILKSRRESQSSPHAPPSSPSNNPHAGFHPSSFGPSFALSALALGASSSTGSSGFAMSISPPQWGGQSQWGNTGWGGQSGSYVGSLGALGTSFGRERDREVEAKYVRDFTCCGKQLNGMHELLEHYEEEHAGVVPDVRMAAMNASNGNSANPAETSASGPQSSFSNANGVGVAFNPQIVGMQHSHAHGHGHGDAPTPPGMMDIEMDMDEAPQHTSHFMTSPLGQRPLAPGGNGQMTGPPALWATAFRAQPHFGNTPPPQCVPPSLLSFSAPIPSTAPGSGPSTPAPPGGQASGTGGGTRQLTQEELEAKAFRKAQRKAERMAAREEASASDAEHEKRFLCPIEGCGKVYKQANGLKYHLTRSINSGHGNVAALGGIAVLLGEKGMGDGQG